MKKEQLTSTGHLTKMLVSSDTIECQCFYCSQFKN